MTKSLKIAAVVLVCLFAGLLQAQVMTGGDEEGLYDRWLSAISMADTRIELSSTLDENITKVPFKEGDKVQKDDLLVKFDTRVIEAQIEVAKTKADFEARIAQAESDYEYYKTEYQRHVKMEGLGAEAEKAKAKHEMDKAELEIQELKRQKAQAEAELTRLEAQKEDYYVRSPIDGVISSRWIEPGEMAERAQKLVEVMDPHVVEVRVNVPERYTQIKEGQKALVRFLPAGDREFKGRVNVVSPYVESKSGTYKVEILVEPDSKTVKPGMSCDVRFLPPSEQ